MVWAVPVSLAATKGIARTFFLIIMAYPKINLIRKKVPYIAFYSSGYWDVSLPQVRILIQGFLLKAGGFPHSEISGSKVIWHLAETYRSHITSFIASWYQGIHHTPFVPIGNVVHRCTFLSVVRRYYSGLCCEPYKIRNIIFVYRGRKDLRGCNTLLKL